MMKIKNVSRMMLFTLVLIVGWAQAGFPLKLDFGLAGSPLQDGFEQFAGTDVISTSYSSEGVTVTVDGGADRLSWRDRTSNSSSFWLIGVPNEAIWIDVVVGDRGSRNMNLTIEGLAPNSDYILTMYSFDIHTCTSGVRQAEWLLDGEVVLTTTWGSSVLTQAEQAPVAETDYVFSGTVRTDATGTIVLVSRRGSAQTASGLHAAINALIIDAPDKASNPYPGYGATEVPLDVTLSWETGRDPNNPSQVYSAIAMHYLYFSDEPNFMGIEPIEIPTGDPVEETAAWGPLELERDKTYYWRVDEGVYIEDIVSEPDDPNTIIGHIWYFETLKSVPLITTQPKNILAKENATAEFWVSAVNPFTLDETGLSYQWYKIGTPDTAVGLDSPVLTIENLTIADAGQYYCIVSITSLPGNLVQSENAILSMARLLAHYQFEQNLLDSAGDNHGSAFGGMEYSEGVVENTYAAEPDGTNYILLPSETAYPRSGFGNGLPEFTISTWVKLETGQEGTLISSYNNEIDGHDGTEFDLSIRSTGRVRQALRDDTGTLRTANTPDDGYVLDDQWHHIVSCFDGETLRIYIDGTEQTSSIGSPLMSFSPWEHPLVLMARNLRGIIDQKFNGQLDDVRIYNYALNAYDVLDLFFEVFPNADPVCVAYPEFDIAGPTGVGPEHRDCKIDLYDLIPIASSWLVDGAYKPEN